MNDFTHIQYDSNVAPIEDYWRIGKRRAGNPLAKHNARGLVK